MLSAVIRYQPINWRRRVERAAHHDVA